MNRSKKKLVVLLSRIPFPLEKGDKLRAFHQIKQLSKCYEIHLCALTFSRSNHQQAVDALADYCEEMLFIRLSWFQRIFGLFQSVLRLRPLQVGLFHNFFTQQKIDNWLAKVQPDAIYVQLHRMAPYVADCQTPKVLDFQDAFSMGVYRRIDSASYIFKPVLWLEYRLLKRYEQLLLKQFRFTTIISDVDKQWIDPVDKYKIQIVLNGVDLDFYKSTTALEKDIDVLFTGNMGYMPNIDASEFLVNEIMPIVWKEKPELKVVIAGANPHVRVLSLKSDRVVVTGYVEDLRAYYLRSKIFIAPMRMGSGLQNKLLEAMAMKVPSITSGIVNISLKAIDKQQVIVSENVKDYAGELLKLHKDPAFSDFISSNALEFVSAFDWERQVGVLCQIIENSQSSKPI